MAARAGGGGAAGVWENEYQVPRQSLQIFRDDKPACRLDLSVTGDFISLDGEGGFLLSDVSSGGEVYRIRYSCS
jgi:hypothetical protein